MPYTPIPADESLRETRRVYALVDHVEPEAPERGERCDIYFDCVNAPWFEERMGQRLGLEGCLEAPSSIIQMSTLAGHDPFSLDLELQDDWLILYLDNQESEGSFLIEHYASLNHAPLVRFLSRFDRPQDDIRAALSRLTSLDSVNSATESEIKKALSRIAIPTDVAVYDVGQGNCNALRVAEIPQLYFDFGGGVLKNIRTYPQNLRFCLEHEQPVVLSHWDWDHWVSATRDRRVTDHRWIVPKQRLGIQHGKLAAELYRKNNLLIWPKNLLHCTVSTVTIRKCFGRTRNDSGLVIQVTDDVVSKGRPKPSEVLLPGDATYSRIPRIGSARLYGLVVTHHGGKLQTHFVPRPVAGVTSKLVCSYGENNSHRHPFSATLLAHRNAGWSAPVRTARNGTVPRGHVAIPIQQLRPGVPCGGAKCDLVVTK